MTGRTDGEQPPYVVYMNTAGTESLSFHVNPPRIGWSGWAAYHSPDPSFADVTARLRFGRRGDERVRLVPLEVRELWMSVDVGTDLGGHVLRALPFSRLEAAVNQPAHADVLAPKLLPQEAHTTPPPTADQRLWLRRPTPQRQRGPRLSLKVPADFRKPDSFYADVAERFLWLSVVSPRPAEDLAEANDVNVTTVHRWVKEARARGLLPAAARISKRGNR